MALDDSGITGTGLNNIGINSALHQIVHLPDLLGLRLKDPDKLLADDLALALRLADAGQLAQKQLLRVGADEVDVPFFKGFLYLIALVEPHEAVVHEHTGELTADSLSHQRRRYRGIHAAGQSQQHLAIAHLFPNLADGNILVIAHGPLALGAADFIEEVANHIRAMLGMVDLRVELDAVKATAFIADSHIGAGLGMGHQRKALRHLFHIVAVAHPRNALGRQTAEQLAVRVEIRLRLAVLPGGILRGRHNAAAQIVGQELAAVANAEDGNPQLENLRVRLRGRGIIHAVGTAGKDNADGVQRLDFLKGCGIGLDLAVYAAFPDAAGNELVILAAEIQNKNHL